MTDTIDWSRFIGIPFVAGGSGPCGLDCYGLVKWVYWDLLRLELPELSGGFWQRDDAARAEWVQRAADAEWVPVDEDDIQPLDVLLFRVDNYPSHVALAIGGDRMLHVLDGMDSVVDRWTAPLWRPRLVQAYRHPEFY